MGAAFILLQRLRYEQRLAARVRLSQGIAPSPTGPRTTTLNTVWTRFLAALGQMLLRSGLLSSRTRVELELTLATAGLRGRNGLEIFVGSKISLMVGLPLLAAIGLRELSLPTMMTVLGPLVAAVIGLLLPDMVVRYRRKGYLAQVEHGLPDALDLLVICSQAGLGLTTAITRVAEEMHHGHQAIGLELALTANDLTLMADSRLALQNMGTRTGLDGLIRLGTTLVQSMQYGTPLTEAMRMLSAEMRQETLVRFENKAARLGVLLTLPMIVFILPCVFLIVGGPAAVQVFGLSDR
jgi:tight adherence protein C